MKRLLAFLGFIAVFPFFVSRRSRVSRSAWIAIAPSGVFPLINTLKNWPLWTEWSRRDLIETYFEGPDAGVGAIQRWGTRCLRGSMQVTGSVPDRLIKYELEARDGRYRMEGEFLLEPVGEGTRVTWSCWWVGGENPYTRYLDIALRMVLGRDFGASLGNLKDVAERSLKMEAR